MAVPIPAPLPPWARAVLYLTPLAVAVGRTLADYFLEADSIEELQWRRFVATFDNTGSLEPSDQYAISFDVMNITGGAVDVTWNDADLDLVATHINNIVEVWKTYMTNDTTFTKIDAYARAFQTGVPGKPYAESGPPVKTWPLGLVGLGTSPCIPQAAFSVTEETSRRANWGRFYLPRVAGNALTAGGRATALSVDAIADAVHTAYSTLMAAELFPVVPVTSVEKTAVQGLYTVTAVRCDDVVDVIRRRRYANPTIREIRPLP